MAACVDSADNPLSPALPPNYLPFHATALISSCRPLQDPHPHRRVEHSDQSTVEICKEIVLFVQRVCSVNTAFKNLPVSGRMCGLTVYLFKYQAHEKLQILPCRIIHHRRWAYSGGVFLVAADNTIFYVCEEHIFLWMIWEEADFPPWCTVRITSLGDECRCVGYIPLHLCRVESAISCALCRLFSCLFDTRNNSTEWTSVQTLLETLTASVISFFFFTFVHCLE